MIKLSRFLSIALLITLTLGMFASSTAAAPNSQELRLMVQYAPGQRGSVARDLNANGAAFHYDFEELNTFVVTIPAAAYPGLSRNPNVVLIEEDVERYPIGIIPSVAAAPLAATAQEVPYGIDMVQARDVWDADRNGSVDAGAPTAANRKICIIDSGFYTGHEDLSGVNVAGYNGNLPWATDGFGHGTHVAGTIVAMNNALGVIGVTPGTVQVYVVRVFGNDGAWSYSSTLIDAAYKCRDAGANIISMSLGGSRSNVTEKNGFATLYNTNGILSIAAAGNAGTSAYSYPASYDSVVSVAAIDSNKAWASFSQYNNQVELAAPGVGVLSTVPYLDSTSLTVDGVTYAAGHIEYSARGTASGALVDGGLCTATNNAWSGKLVLCQRGDISFYDKVHNVQLSGGAAAAIYNNVSGGFLGTLGEGYSSTIIGISLSQEDGQYLVANKLGQSATVSSLFSSPGSGYEAWDGTSMATPHASAVAALAWSAKPTASNAEIRQVLRDTALDLGAAGRDNYFGYGLVRAKAAVDALVGVVPNQPPTASFTFVTSDLTATFTDASTDSDGSIVAWNWGFGDGATSTVMNPTHTYAAAGTYTVSLTVTDDKSATSSTSRSVTVSSSTATMSVKDLDATKTIAKNNWKATVTITVKDANGTLLSGVTVAGKFNTTAVSCTTASGVCSVSATLKSNVTSVTYTVTNLTASGYTYNATANSDPDGDSNGTSITITK
jgi:subtilisin family serine protease